MIDLPLPLADCNALGNRDLLNSPKLALFCSVRCPGKLILRTYDLVRELRDAEVTLVGGFHSPMEQECLRLVLRGANPVIVCPARGIDRLRVPVEWATAMTAGRLLVLSPFTARERRMTKELAERRNAFLIGVADRVFVAYAAPGGSTEHMTREAIRTGKHVLTLAEPENALLLALGAQPVTNGSDLVREMNMVGSDGTFR